MLTPMFGYNHARDAYVIRGVGRHVGPVLRPDRRTRRERSRLAWNDAPWRERATDALASVDGLVAVDGIEPADGVDRRRASWA
jgi:hypothetical protein